MHHLLTALLMVRLLRLHIASTGACAERVIAKAANTPIRKIKPLIAQSIWRRIIVRGIITPASLLSFFITKPRGFSAVIPLIVAIVVVVCVIAAIIH